MLRVPHWSKHGQDGRPDADDDADMTWGMSSRSKIAESTPLVAMAALPPWISAMRVREEVNNKIVDQQHDPATHRPDMPRSLLSEIRNKPLRWDPSAADGECAQFEDRSVSAAG